MHHDVEVDAAEGGEWWQPQAARMGCTGRGGEGQLARRYNLHAQTLQEASYSS